jgi:hypothetical protein
MDVNAIAMWRDAALTLLAIEAIVLGLLPAAALCWGLRRVRRLLQWIRPVLFETRLHVWRIQYQTRRVLNALAAPFLWLQNAVAGLQRALQMLGWR